MSDAAPIYLDCDTGIDDALALAYLLASPEVHLAGIGTVSGNTSATVAAENTLALLALAGREEIPVAVGAIDPVRGSFRGGAPHVHGSNGIGGVVLEPAVARPDSRHAADMLIDLAKAYPGELRVLAVGPLTNLAVALEREPNLPALVRDVVVMGGAALAPGNTSPVAEANIANDPEAAAAVLQAGWDITMVPLDVTMEHIFDEQARKRLLEAPDAVSRVVGEALESYLDFYLDIYGYRACALHDPLAAALLVGTVTATRAARVPVVVDEGDGPGRGQTIVDMRGQRRGPVDVPGARCQVVLETDLLVGPVLLDRLAGPPVA
ncbi:nucleoside hydrolase [Ruania halotolerans]|uniref:nucleoside hydrolase n=1 Tax=Ruania halotolerans TaxID=2897773 RepID=UPI001E5128BB|nr:nucleoside hydrolase [Ruania halotolerans]UFU05893.1 nucleoside hydrolase [Ruania halotolerans]